MAEHCFEKLHMRNIWQVDRNFIFLRQKCGHIVFPCFHTRWFFLMVKTVQQLTVLFISGIFFGLQVVSYMISTFATQNCLVPLNYTLLLAQHKRQKNPPKNCIIGAGTFFLTSRERDYFRDVVPRCLFKFICLTPNSPTTNPCFRGHTSVAK